MVVLKMHHPNKNISRITTQSVILSRKQASAEIKALNTKEFGFFKIIK